MSAEARVRARNDVWKTARAMFDTGLVVASSGNVSCRLDDEPAVAITPTSLPWTELESAQIALVGLDGSAIDAPLVPSCELPMHLAVYAARKDVRGIVHSHSTSVTALSLLHLPLPPVIDEMAMWFGGEVAVAEYGFSGSATLARNVVRALGDRAATMLSNHGDVCVGSSLGEALRVATLMEATARTYIAALSVGEPVRLSQEAIAAGRALYEKRRSGA